MGASRQTITVMSAQISANETTTTSVKRNLNIAIMAKMLMDIISHIQILIQK